MSEPSLAAESALRLCYEMNREFRTYPRLNSKASQQVATFKVCNIYYFSLLITGV